MNRDELKEQYRQDELLHPEGKPWEWWQFLSSVTSTWRDCQDVPMQIAHKGYRRKSTAPNWDKELSPKEVAECDEWPAGYEVLNNINCNVVLHWCGEPVWNSVNGWMNAITETGKGNILDHFKKRREAKLATPTKVADCDPKPSKDEVLRDEAIARFTEKATSKFNAGIQEHNPNGGNDLEDRATFADLEDEVIDLWFYVQGLKRRIHRT